MKKISIIYNPESGSGESEKNAKKVKEQLEQSDKYKDIDIQMHATKDSKDAYKFAKKCSQEKYELIVSIGGDGTINQIAGGIIDGGNHSKLAIMPLGTVNNMANALKIPTKFEDSIKIVEEGNIRNIDIAKVNKDYMISSMTIGLLADAAINVTSEKKRKFGPLAYVIDFLRVLKKYRGYSLVIKHDEGELKERIMFLLVTMTDSVGGMSAFTPDAKVDDGYMHVLTMSKLSIGKLIRYLPKLLRSDFSDMPEIHYFQTSEMTIEKQNKDKKKKVQTRIDGDPSSSVPIKSKVLKQELKVLAPKES
ncbi:diacylglycerol/lipid kinase family protein [Breznakia pachnodae]|uniref:YegS/Rv2252/BmrU family lipid kinase n=1 Tax=Breznakia pachnodae TaxID=265178 RepID=A0ABU0E531_9FIRM|nr:diacylglycerol kinase family protein [Breznakia pachnodae]MDQ0362008.1 YegS/Rv2252/BmrU family lipid kinase [Breznakia pachnodae]